MLLVAYSRWAFWSVIYLFAPRSKDLGKHLTRLTRTRPPWWKFRPHAWHNDDGHQWEIWLDDASSYSKQMLLPVTVHIDQDNGKIVGFNIYDETLLPPKSNAGKVPAI